MFPITPYGNVNPRNAYGPTDYGWSKLFDYDGSGKVIYICHIPTASGGTPSAVGYIQKFTYSGTNLTKSEWAVPAAVAGTTVAPNPMAKWADRTTLTYQ